MSISPTNIKTRIELETRVLAAALKQSFERGDSDGVGLAHRQLYLLLKDQKPGNGSSSVVAETRPTGSNGDTSNYRESAEQIDDQQAYNAADFAKSEIAEYAQSFQTSEPENYQVDLQESEEEQHQADVERETDHELDDEDGEEVEEGDDSDEANESDGSQVAEDDEAEEPQHDRVQEQEQIRYLEDVEVPQIPQAVDVDYVDTHQVADEVEESQEHDPEQAHAIAQYLKYKQTRDQLSTEEGEQSDNIEPLPGWHEVEAQTGATQSVEQLDGFGQTNSEVVEEQVSAPPALTEEEEYVRMRKAPPVAKELLPFDQPSAEYAEIFGSSIIETPASSPAIEPVVPSTISSQSSNLMQGFTPTVGLQPASSPQYPNTQPGPFDALPEPPSYGQFISSTPPSSHDTEAVMSDDAASVQAEVAPVEEVEATSVQAEEATQVSDLGEEPGSAELVKSADESSEHDDSQGWETIDPTDIPHVELHQAPKPKRGFIEEPIQEVDLTESEPEPIAIERATERFSETAPEDDAELAAELDSEQTVADVVDDTPKSEAAPTDGPWLAQQPAATSQPEPVADQIAPPPKFDGFYAPQNLGVRNMASGFAPPPESSDLPAELRKAPTTEFPKVLPNPTQDLPMVGQNMTQDLPMIGQNSTQDLPMIGQSLTQDLPMVAPPPAQDLPTVPQNSTQDLPLIMNDIRSQQAADYAARKASQSSPRNMPAIDFSLQSESNKPDIDFSLQSESQSPNIDFTTQPKSNKPDIDFSLQSESGKPDIDFSLQSENQAPESLNAPTGGGIIEAEFVTSDSDSTTEDQPPEDVTAELPVLNPAASLYLEPDETEESQTQKLAAEHSATQRTPVQPVEAPIPQPTEPAAVPPKNTVPYTGIPMMVIPNHAAPRVVQAPLAAADASETTGQEEPIPAAPKPPDLYAMLGVSQMSPFEEIHKNFLRKIRKILLKLRGAVRPERDELLKELRRNWVARDILCDPVTRTDYDFRDMGLRGSPDGTVTHVEDGPQRIGQRTPLRIGELLQCAGLLEQAELEIACDMHKAMPEVQFGTFLVRQGFIQERDLDSVLLGQSLLRDGKITVAQFQVAMELSQSRGANISDTLIEHGYITAAELAKLTEKAAEPTDGHAADIPTIKEVAVKPRQIEPAAPTNLNASSAVPTWKDQLDWSKPLPVDDDASLMDRNPEKQSLADLLGNVNTEAAEPEKVKISNNAAPSWKDQLDWEQPSDQPATDATTNSATEQATGSDQQAQTDETPSPISSANAVPSWKDQLDWEQPKDESQAQSQTLDATAPAEEQSEDDEYYDDEPMTHSSKETQPISIHPPTSVAPNVTLGKGNPGTTVDTSTESTAEDKYLQEVLQTTDIFEQPIPTTSTEAVAVEHSDEQHEEHDDHDEHDDDAPPSEEGEGFLKKTLGKLKKGDPKDKKKKRK